MPSFYLSSITQLQCFAQRNIHRGAKYSRKIVCCNMYCAVHFSSSVLICLLGTIKLYWLFIYLVRTKFTINNNPGDVTQKVLELGLWVLCSVLLIAISLLVSTKFHVTAFTHTKVMLLHAQGAPVLRVLRSELLLITIYLPSI